MCVCVCVCGPGVGARVVVGGEVAILNSMKHGSLVAYIFIDRRQYSVKSNNHGFLQMKEPI